MVHPLQVMVNAYRRLTCFASFKHRDVGRWRLVINVRYISEENHINSRFEDLIALSPISGKLTLFWRYPRRNISPSFIHQVE